MTLEEIRAAKVEAESDIRARLKVFREKTGMCPVALSLTVYSCTTINSVRAEAAVGEVTISLEAI